MEYKRKRRAYSGRNPRFLGQANGAAPGGRMWGQVMTLSMRTNSPCFYADGNDLVRWEN